MSMDPDTISTSSSGDVNKEEMEALKAENESLRFALELTQEKLQRLMMAHGLSEEERKEFSTTTDDGHRGQGATGVKQEGSVVFALMRRMLLKDRNFLPKTFLPFLDIEDLGRYVTVPTP